MFYFTYLGKTFFFEIPLENYNDYSGSSSKDSFNKSLMFPSSIALAIFSPSKIPSTVPAEITHESISCNFS